MLCSVRLMLIY